MDAKGGADNTKTFVPKSDLIQEAECDTLLIYLPGFTKEQLRVQLTKEGILKITGTRPIGDNKWSSFQKDFPVSPNCDRQKITAKFEGGILYVRQPKLIVPGEGKPQTIPTPEITPHPDQKPQAPQKIAQEQEKTTPTDDKNMQRSDHKEPEAKVEEKSREPDQGAKKEERKREKDSISDHVDASKGISKRESGAGGDYKLKVDKLKTVRKMTTMVMAVVFACILGLYVCKYMGRFEKKAES